MHMTPLKHNSAFNGAALTTASKASNSAMKMTFESEIGAQAPIGFWDPLGLVADADQERFDRLRYVEIKHGRIAMLAVAGHLTQQNVRLPGMLSFKDNIAFEDVPNGLAAFSKIPPLGTLQIILAIGVHELFVVKQVRACACFGCGRGRCVCLKFCFVSLRGVVRDCYALYHTYDDVSTTAVYVV